MRNKKYFRSLCGARRRFSSGLLLVALSTASTAGTAASYVGSRGYDPELCREFKSDLIAAKVGDMTDAELCALSLEKIIPQIDFLVWKRDDDKKALEYLEATRREAYLPQTPRPPERPELMEFARHATADGDLHASASLFKLRGKTFDIRRIDTSPCRSAGVKPDEIFDHLYKWVYALPAYLVTLNGREIPMQAEIGGRELGFPSKDQSELLEVAIDRSWSTVTSVRRIQASIFLLSFVDPAKDSINPIDKEAEFKPYFAFHGFCQVDITKSSKDGNRHD